MVDRTEADGLFKLKSPTAKSKADITDATVREYLKEEHDARTALTNKLRAARLAREAETPEPPAPKRAVPQRPRFRT